MKVFRFLIGIALLIGLLWVFYDYTFNHKISLIGFDQEPHAQRPREVPLSQISISALAMVLGILFGSVYDNVNRKKGTVNLKRVVADSIRSAHFFKALLAAPIVFAGVYLASRSQPDVVVAFLFAFQNGFFCDAILRDRKGVNG